MTRPESDAPDSPFPGAHSQVPRAHTLEHNRLADTRLPLEMRVIHPGAAWAVRLPVRAEALTVSKELVVVERITAARKAYRDTVRIEDSVQREVLHVETEGDPKLVSDSEPRK